MLSLVVVTHVTARSSKSMDSFIMNLLHTNTPVCDFEISTQRFRSLAVVDLVVATYLHWFMQHHSNIRKMLVELKGYRTS